MSTKKKSRTGEIWRNVIISVLVGILFFVILDTELVHVRRSQVRAQVESYADNQISNRINKHTFFASIWDTILRQEQGDVDHFNRVCGELVESYGSGEIEAIYLAPNGRVEYCYGADIRISNGMDLMTAEFCADDVLYAKENGVSVLSHFLENEDGTFNLYVYDPVSIPDEKGKETFWGYSVVALKVPDLFMGIGLTDLGDRLDYRVSGIGEDGSEKVYIGNSDATFAFPIEYNFTVQNETLHFSAIWKGCWLSYWEFLWQGMLVVAILLLTGLFTSLKVKKNELTRLSRHDMLTGLNNRYALRDTFDNLVSMSEHISVLFFDVDDFKLINDSIGHVTGDAVLKLIADRLVRIFGEENCFRYGGDEFLVLLPNGDPKVLDSQIREMTNDLKLELPEGQLVEVTISGGRVDGLVQTADDLRMLIAKADRHLYDAKKAGKNRVN